ncbi:HIT domain-containing protein [Bacteroidota bacterium]
MTYNELLSFLSTKMRMSHIYQPLLIKLLVDSGGISTIRQLAQTFLNYDESQILYYEKRLKEMPIKVLKQHEVIIKDGEVITLNINFKKLTLEERAELKKVCETKIQEYISKRGIKIWDYRLLDTIAIPDPLRYRVLSESNGRCSLCGATKDDRPLDVDHIIPKSKGGKTVYENLQVLCSKCNRSKGNKDDTDFRKIIKESYIDECKFCNISNDRIIYQNDLASLFLDSYPVTKGHSLIIPKRHILDYFELTRNEKNAIDDLILIQKKSLIERDNSIKGFNIGSNAGEVAGQTIMHCHFHLMPRREGDVCDPTGGVRGVIPDKMKY